MNILITGGCGFKGTELAEQLSKKHNITIIDTQWFGNYHTNPKIKVIKENQNCHHVYLWRKDVTDIKATYEKKKLRYTLCDINDSNQEYYEFRRKLTKDAIFSMLINYV